MMDEILEPLFVADPDLAGNVLVLLKKRKSDIPKKYVAMLVEETFWGIDQEISFGYGIAIGFAMILSASKEARIEIYRNILHETSRKGATLGSILANHLPPVLISGNEILLKKFLHTVSIMESKGTYTLRAPLEALPELLNANDQTVVSLYLDLLTQTFSQNITYNQSLHFTHLIPNAVRGIKNEIRSRLLPVLVRIARADVHLIEPFLEGFGKHLYLLSKEALNGFADIGLEALNRSRQSASKFMALDSGVGLETFRSMQVTVPFAQVCTRLDQYLQARTGMTLTVKPLSGMANPESYIDENIITVVSDGRHIFLPEKIGIYSSAEKNINLYKCLTKLEAGLYEFGTFDFDIEKLEAVKGFYANRRNHQSCDLTEFFARFSVSALAKDMFAVFEHGRIHFLMKQKYPGMVRHSMPFLEDEINRLLSENDHRSPLLYLYQKIILDKSLDNGIFFNQGKELEHIAGIFHEKIERCPQVETTALLVMEFYPTVKKWYEKSKPQRTGSIANANTMEEAAGSAGEMPQNLTEIYKPLTIPFSRKISPELYFSKINHLDILADSIKIKLKKQGITIFKSDIRKQLIKKGGHFYLEDLKELVLLSGPIQNDPDHQRISFNCEELDLDGLVGVCRDQEIFQDDDAAMVYRYREWNCHLRDYIHNHVRVLDRFMEEKEDAFYQQTLARYRGLVSRIRYAFELLKPEQLKILRPWVEGDDFDYRAMLDFAIDKKAGWLPSDRLYIKRLKQQRDVAVLLLVDLSKSTSNPVFESTRTVLDVEKEAIVLFCEALEVLGDKSAIAGFSGTGRLGVDYYRIKDFSEPLNDKVTWRINAMSPRRNTRMGAAIRHGVSELEKVEALVRLLILLGDGFPNDVDYKQDYAIEDTRKASSEAFAKNITFKAITVNIAGDPRLDDLYGDSHHTVISEVRELPDKLLRIYSSLTKY